MLFFRGDHLVEEVKEAALYLASGGVSLALLLFGSLLCLLFLCLLACFLQR